MRSRAHPWFVVDSRRLDGHAVEVDRLEEAGGVWYSGAVLCAVDLQGLSLHASWDFVTRCDHRFFRHATERQSFGPARWREFNNPPVAKTFSAATLLECTTCGIHVFPPPSGRAFIVYDPSGRLGQKARLDLTEAAFWLAPRRDT